MMQAWIESPLCFKGFYMAFRQAFPFVLLGLKFTYIFILVM